MSLLVFLMGLACMIVGGWLLMIFMGWYRWDQPLNAGILWLLPGVLLFGFGKGIADSVMKHS